MSSIYILTQLDLKKIIAYSSISHMNFVISAWSTLNIWGNMGIVITSLAHGLSSSALFIMSGYLYDRTHSINLQPLFN
jgi:NADH-quinone oxidoreductase subunit M